MPFSISPSLSKVQGTVQKRFKIPSDALRLLSSGLNNSPAMLVSQDSHHLTAQTQMRVWSGSRTKAEKGKERRSLKVKRSKDTAHTVLSLGRNSRAWQEWEMERKEPRASLSQNTQQLPPACWGTPKRNVECRSAFRPSLA